MSKTRLYMKLSSAVAILLYLTALVGFDIHVDKEHQHIYVRSMLANLSCEAIHPDEACGHSAHNHFVHDHDCEEGEDCCEDISDQLNPTCIDNGQVHVAPAVIAIIPQQEPVILVSDFTKRIISDILPAPDGPPLSELCILRV